MAFYFFYRPSTYATVRNLILSKFFKVDAVSVRHQLFCNNGIILVKLIANFDNNF